MSDWNTLPSNEIIEKTIQALKANGFEAYSVETGAQAKEKALSLIAPGSEVFTMTSVTVDSIGLSAALNDFGKYDSVRGTLGKMDGNTQGREMRKLGAAPDVAVGSVHALTQSGKLLVASLTGSQLPAYAYGAGKVVFLVSAKKIVPGLDEAWNRLVEHVVPEESVRARKAYGLPDSFDTYPSKVMILNKEVQPGRVSVIVFNEEAGF
ncbi:MAG: hypothetical protein FD137_2499 [Spirochaetes bacterium]|nr:MAG: hypothetical protein FD137_2499 [Spirochaetota bacterium]